MRKIYQAFESPCSLPKSPYFFTLFCSVSLRSNLQEHLLLSGSYCAHILLWQNHWLYLLSPKNNWSMSLFLISITLYISQPFHQFCCWQGNKLRASMKTLLLLLIKSPNTIKFCFLTFFCFFGVFLFFIFFVLFFFIETTTADLQSLTQTPQTVLNKSR